MVRDSLLLVARFGALLCVACGDGVGQPIVGIASGGTGGAGTSAAVTTGGAAPETGSATSSGGLPGIGGSFGTGGDTPGPAADYCAPVAAWPEASIAAEETTLAALNLVRRFGVTCADQRGPSVPELVIEPALVCAARRHSLDMVERDFFSHTSPDGEGPEERVARAGYPSGRVGEVIARVPLEDFVAQGGEDCALLVDAGFVAVGVGVHEDVWTIVLGGPAE